MLILMYVFTMVLYGLINFPMILIKNIFIIFWQIQESLLASQKQEGTQGNLNTTIVSELILPLPPLSEQNKIASILASLDSKIDTKQKKHSHTKALKKALMNDLLTGKKRVNVN